MKRSVILSLLLILFLGNSAISQDTKIKYLSGTGKDRTVNWEFFCTKGMNSGKWTSIPVPSNWELQGFGAYNYGQDKTQADEQGLYRFHFQGDPAWKSQDVKLVFEGVMTDAEVKLNGRSAGPIHQGSFYRFSFPVSSLLKAGDNLLEVTVSKKSADPSVNRAERQGDFWIFGGIFRPVYLEIAPATSVDRVAIDARGTGDFRMDVFARNLQRNDRLVTTLKPLKAPTSAGVSFSEIVNDPGEPVTVHGRLDNPKTWNPETPNLYVAEVRVKRGERVLHRFTQRFGFRTVEVRKSDGIYVNGVKIVMKGVNRHSAWPESGRTLSREIHLKDIGLMKDMNMNAVRMSHYPPDPEFLDLCDSLGLFVLDELTGWQQHYDTPVGEKLVKELVTRDVNHPSIILWDNGNEGGWNTALDDDFAPYDPQKRTVIHPWSNFNNIDTKHYPDYSYVEAAAKKDDILLHTEMIHGLYDGGHGASLDDYWKLVRANPRHAGGFLWVLADEGVVRKDKKDSIDTDGNHAPDGIVGPHREKEASFYTIKEIWSPVQVTPLFLQPGQTAGLRTRPAALDIENRYLYTDLSSCSFSWQLVNFPLAGSGTSLKKVKAAGKFSVQLSPGKSIVKTLNLPTGWQASDALLIKAADRTGRELYTWSFPVRPRQEQIAQNHSALGKPGAKPVGVLTGTRFVVSQDRVAFAFDTRTGLLDEVSGVQGLSSFGKGPVLAGPALQPTGFSHREGADGSIVVESSWAGADSLHAVWTFTPGEPVRLDYDYTQSAAAGFYGITFNVDEARVKGVRWLGDGPFRTWRNRLKGVTYGVWEKKYNSTITGETFVYPEFKGYHANLRWASVDAGNASFTVINEKPGVFFGLLKPQQPRTAFIPHVNPAFPEGNIGFLNAIPPIGTKFKGANTMGPNGQKNQPVKGRTTGRLWFSFGSR